MDSKIKYPRVLIISHNPLSETQNNGKTLFAFFRQWDSDNLAQLYITSDIPDFSICKKFFQLTDADILKRFFFNKKAQGRTVTYSNVYDIKKFGSNKRRNPITKILKDNIPPLFRFLRDLLWFFADCKTQELINFIDEFNPQIVFFQSSNGTFAFSLTKWICKNRKIPLIMQTTDDYVSGKFTLDPFFWIQLFRLQKLYQWAVSYSNCVIAIGDKMAEEYKLRFDGNYFVAMNSVTTCVLPGYPEKNNTVKFLYAGNLGLNRWKVLALIAECLKELSIEESLKGELLIYSLVEPSSEELSKLNVYPFSLFKGAINAPELKDIKANSDFLVHVEAFDKTNKHITRLSISTKIPEYLASGRCIFAVGPADVASMQYLIDYDLGITVTSDKKYDIKKNLKEAMLNEDIKIKYAEKGINIAKSRHNSIETAEKIFNIISTTVKKG